MAVQSAHFYRPNSFPMRPRNVTWIEIKREGVKSGCSDALKPDRLVLSCKDNKCSNAETGDRGVLTSHEILPYISICDADSTRPW